MLLHDLELFSSLASQCIEGFAYPQQAINDNWKIVLRNQFHDILPGSSIHEVYEDSQREFAEVFESGGTHLQKSLQSLASATSLAGPRIVVFNPVSWSRGGAIQIPWAPELAEAEIIDEDGSPVPVHIIDDRGDRRLEIQVPEVPGLGYRAFAVSRSKSVSTSDWPESTTSVMADAVVSVDDRRIESRFYTIELDERGRIVRLYDKEAQREVIAPGRAANVLQAFEDRPMSFDAWDIDLYYQDKAYSVDDLVVWEVSKPTPSQAVIRLKWKLLDSTIEQRMIVRGDSRRIDFKTDVDWHEHQVLLKVAFPVDIRATKATYEIQFGNVERPTHWNTSWDFAKFETVAHRWVDLSEQDYGVSLLNDCKYGHDIKDNSIRLTLIKSGIEPDPMADQGHHSFTYSLYPHTGSWFIGGTVREAYELNFPLRCAYADGPSGYLPTAGSLATTKAASTILDTVKRSEDDDSLILRFYEVRQQARYGQGRVPFGSSRCLRMQSHGEADRRDRILWKRGRIPDAAVRDQDSEDQVFIDEPRFFQICGRKCAICTELSR